MFRLILSLALLMSCGANRAPAQTQSHVDRTTIEAFVDGAVREAVRADHIAGVSIAIVDRAGVVMARGYGAAAFDPYRKADADTLFRVGSISKTPVWIAIMQLVEQGKLSLDDPINNRLPPSLQVPDEGFQKPILVRHLMTHTAGFEDSTEGLFVHDPTKLMTLDQSLAAYRVHRVREPGTLAVYSNYGAALAGALVAHVAGETWQDYAERRILRPLGLATATYREPYPESVATARDLPEPMAAEVLAKTTNGFSWSSGAYHTQPFEYVSDDAPAGTLSASANDMAKYMQALLDPELMANAGVLKVETALALRQPLFANTPELGAMLHGFFDLSASRGRSGFGHGGALVFQKSTMEVYPDEGFAIFISANTPAGGTLLDKLPALLLDLAYPMTLPAAPRAKDAETEGARVAGVYRGLRVATYRSEAPLNRYFSGFTVRALPSGNIVVAGDRRYRPIGDGVFASIADHERIAFHERGGRMTMFDSSGLSRRSRWVLSDWPLAAVDLRRRCHFGSVGDCGGCRALCSWRSSRSRGSARSRCVEPPLACVRSVVASQRSSVGQERRVVPLYLSRDPLSHRLLGAARRGDRHADQRSDRALRLDASRLELVAVLSQWRHANRLHCANSNLS
jgi:CubicO group peptidase (beta-lactamase class C family)